MLSAEKRGETHLVGNEQKEKWIEHYVDTETTVERN